MICFIERITIIQKWNLFITQCAVMQYIMKCRMIYYRDKNILRKNSLHEECKIHKKKAIYTNGLWKWLSTSEMTSYSSHLECHKTSTPRLPKYMDENVICNSLWHIECSVPDIRNNLPFDKCLPLSYPWEAFILDW